MKNPFKGIGDKLKNLKDKLTATRKHESAKAVVDGVGDSGIIGGLMLVGTAAFLPAAPMTVLIAGGVFIAAGAGAKYVASKMKPGIYDVTNPPEAKTPPAENTAAPVKGAKPVAPEFKKTVEKTATAPVAGPSAKAKIAPQP